MILLIGWIMTGGVCAVIGARMARKRNRRSWLWTLICFFFTLIGIALLAILGSDSDARQPAAEPMAGPETMHWTELLAADPEIAAAASPFRGFFPQGLSRKQGVCIFAAVNVVVILAAFASFAIASALR